MGRLRPILRWCAALLLSVGALGFGALAVGFAIVAVVEAGEADHEGRFSTLALVDFLLVPLCAGLAAVSVWLLVDLVRR